MLLDLHTHTRIGSPDSFLDPDELIERSKEAGLDGIVLSEHDMTWDREELQALARHHNFLVIPGLEVSTDRGHILAYGVAAFEEFMRQSDALADRVALVGGALVAAHPYREHAPLNWRDAEEYERAIAHAAASSAYRRVHAVEVLNGHGTLNDNEFSELVARRLGLPGTAGTDSHQRSDIGKAATYFERDIHDEHDLVREILAGRCWAVDLTAGSLTQDASRHSVPESLASVLAPR
ncbi:MAG: PHP domain-containing protein [Dehalococcoidia bacterium]